MLRFLTLYVGPCFDPLIAAKGGTLLRTTNFNPLHKKTAGHRTLVLQREALN
jgi:hypothetical protein